MMIDYMSGSCLKTLLMDVEEFIKSRSYYQKENWRIVQVINQGLSKDESFTAILERIDV